MGIRQILADNMREFRRERGFSQVKLAEQADVSAQYIAMIEMCSKFPKPEMLERLAKSLDIEVHDFFRVAPRPQDELEKIRQEIRLEIRGDINAFKQDIIDEVVKAVKQTLSDNALTEFELVAEKSRGYGKGGKKG